MGICLNWGFRYSLSWPYLSGEVPQHLSLGRKAVLCCVLQTHGPPAIGAVTVPGAPVLRAASHPAWCGDRQVVSRGTGAGKGDMKQKVALVLPCLSLSCPPRSTPTTQRFA